MATGMSHDDAADIQEARRILRRLHHKLAALFIIAAGDAEDVKRDAWYRASGDSTCPACGRPYREHMQDPLVWWLVVLCDGRRVKL